MSYERALIVAGAEVLEFERFGSYQGDWWAKVKYNDDLGWAHGTYGSCTECDSFQSEFNYDYNLVNGRLKVGDEYTNYDTYEEELVTQDVLDNIQIKLADFGKVYLEGLMTQEQAIKYASRYIDWDDDAVEMVKFIQDNKL